MNSILSFLFRVTGDAQSNIVQGGGYGCEEKESLKGKNEVKRARPSRRISARYKKSGLILESRDAKLTTEGLTARTVMRKAESERGRLSAKVFRVTDEYIRPCQDLADEIFAEDSVCRYLRGKAVDDPALILMRRYYTRSREFALRRAIVKGDIPVRASVVRTERDQMRELVQACAGFALWRVVSDETRYSFKLLLFDMMTIHRRLLAVFDEVYSGMINGHMYRFEYDVPGGLVDDTRFSKHVKLRKKVVTKLLHGRRYLTVQNLCVGVQFRHSGIGTSLLRYGLDISDTQNLPVYLESSSVQFLKLCEKFGFELVHELRLRSNDEKNQSCSIYCMVREPGIKKLSPLPIL
ncbi:hypothetical protein V1512DRAFT_233512 [Lipomyces arxii]|uniref:uncharacterized protein n=1 Tax=Lipomyces arxii TaxID=56418 RepID=UPI0034CDFAAE